jgi:hypothetical protein
MYDIIVRELMDHPVAFISIVQQLVNKFKKDSRNNAALVLGFEWNYGDGAIIRLQRKVGPGLIEGWLHIITDGPYRLTMDRKSGEWTKTASLEHALRSIIGAFDTREAEYFASLPKKAAEKGLWKPFFLGYDETAYRVSKDFCVDRVSSTHSETSVIVTHRGQTWELSDRLLESGQRTWTITDKTKYAPGNPVTRYRLTHTVYGSFMNALHGIQQYAEDEGL